MQVRSLSNLLKAVTIFIFCGLFLTSLLTEQCVAQDPPNEKVIFEKDSSDFITARKATVKGALGVDASTTDNLDFKAPNVEFYKDKNVIKGTGGAVISQSGTIAQADSAEVNLTTKQTQLDGKVVINTSTASLKSEKADFNFDTEAGVFNNAGVLLEDGGYKADAEKLEKLTETKYNLFDSIFTTCHCADGTKPWTINSSESNITQESYAHCYNTTVDFHGVPIFYTPYLAFPVKTERQSGLLAPTYGYSNQDGVQFKQPVFAVIDDSTDMTISPFIENQSRYGSQFDFRKIYSKRSKIDARLIYSDESAREDSLRGVNTVGIFDTEIDQNRVLGFYNQRWQNDQSAEVPLQFLSDIHYASDDLAVREFNDPKIAEQQSRYITSRMVMRAGLTDYLTSSVEGEYNQFIDQDDDLGFQRYPSLNINELKSFRPFGYNPLGARLVTKSLLSVTQFNREEGYDGVRTSFTPNLAIPFHVKNYLASEMGVGMRYSSYNMNNVVNPALMPDGSASPDLDDSMDTKFYNAYFGVSSAVEKVYGVDEDSWLVYLTNLGKNNQEGKLKRVKHTIEPYVKYSFVPPTSDQDELPFFDSTDRARQKSVFTYGFVSNLYGRFVPFSGSGQKITELTPKIEELPDLNSVNPVADFGSLDDYSGLGGVSPRSGSLRNLVSFSMKQAYDYVEDEKDLQPFISPYSDVQSGLTLFPTKDFALTVQNFYNAETSKTSYWTLATHMRDDRGDALKLRYTFTNENKDLGTLPVSQIEGNLELYLSQQLRFGYYAYYDEEKSDSIRERMVLRLVSACNCWNFDLGYGETLNPDREFVFLTFTFSGLGDLSQSFGLNNSNNAAAGQ